MHNSAINQLTAAKKRIAHIEAKKGEHQIVTSAYTPHVNSVV
jgi:hypothetical protein